MTVCKRIGAWLLTLVLLVSALPYTAFAASEDSHVVNATMEETSVEDIANNVTTTRTWVTKPCPTTAWEPRSTTS